MMTALFLTTVITCQQINEIIQRVWKSNFLSPIQKKEIVFELKKITLTCFNQKNEQ